MSRNKFRLDRSRDLFLEIQPTVVSGRLGKLGRLSILICSAGAGTPSPSKTSKVIAPELHLRNQFADVHQRPWLETDSIKRSAVSSAQ